MNSNHNGHNRNSINIIIIDTDSFRCSRRINLFAKHPDIGEIISGMDLQDILGMNLEMHFDVALVSVEFLSPTDFSKLTRSFREYFPESKVIATEAPDESSEILAYLEAGAWDYLGRRPGKPKLISKIRSSANGRSRVSPDVTAALIDRIYELAQYQPQGASLSNGEGDLTPREREVLALIAQRMSNRQIAEELVLEVGTVKNHVHNLLKKLDADNRYEAAAMAVEPFVLPTGYSK